MSEERRGLLSPKNGPPPSTTMSRLSERCCGIRDASGLQLMLLIGASLFFYALAYHSNDVVLPYLLKSIGVDTVVYGYLTSWVGILGVFGGVVLGRVADRYGALWVLLLTHVGGAITYIMLAAAKSTPVVFLSVVPSLLQQGFEASVMIVATQSDEASRTKAIGRLSLFYGAGALIGPLCGGFLSKNMSNATVVLLSGIMSAAVAALVLGVAVCGVGEDKAPGVTRAAHKSSGSIFSCAEIARLLRTPGARTLWMVKFLSATSSVLVFGMLSQFLMADYKLAEEKNGMVLSYIEVINMVSSGLLVSVVVAAIGSDARATLACLYVATVSLGALCFAGSSLTALIVILLPLGMAGISGTIITGMMSKIVSKADVGGIIGIDMSARSIAGIFAPVVAGYLNKAGGFRLVCAAAAGVGVVSIVFAHVFLGDAMTAGKAYAPVTAGQLGLDDDDGGAGGGADEDDVNLWMGGRKREG